MDIMLLDVHCYDVRPKSIDVSRHFTGDTFDPDSEEYEEFKKTGLVFFGRASCGSSACVIYENYKPWSRIMNTSSTVHRLETVKHNIMQYLGLQFHELVVMEEKKSKFFGFEPGSDKLPKTFQCFKIYLPSFECIRKFEQMWKYKSEYKKSKIQANAYHYLTSDFECTDYNTPPNIKALNELKLAPSSWFSIDSSGVSQSARISTCKYEYYATKIEPKPDITQIAPLKIMSFDAEMYSHDNGFPDVLHGDYVSAICATIMIYGSSVRLRHAFVLWPLETQLLTKTEHLILHYCKTSDEVLEQFRDLVVSEDPDIITGWNIYGFDMPFLWDQYESSHSRRSQRGSEQMRSDIFKCLDRPGFLTTKDLLDRDAKLDSGVKDIRWKLVLKKPDELPELIGSKVRSDLRSKLKLQSEEALGLTITMDDFALLQQKNIRYFNQVMEPPRRESSRRFEYLSRFLCEKSTLTEKRMASSAKGDNTYYFWSGRTCVDLMQIIKDDKKLDDNTLKFTAQTYLDPDYGKIDFSPAEIFKCVREQDPIKMAQMIDYCVRDADIPIDLMVKLSYIPQWFEMSRVSFTPVSQVLNGGQQRKVYNLISHFVHDSHAMNAGRTDWPISIDDGTSDYQGATVIEPLTGFYTESVSTLDFESLYPSIIIHFNLCPSVYVSKSTKVPDDFFVEHHDIVHTNSDKPFTQTYGFVKNVQGIIPQLLQYLLKSRKIAKKAMNNATTEFEKAVQNGRQLALKVSCNSVYGFFGVNESRGLLSCKPIAAVTTLRGRAFIEASKLYVEKAYPGSIVLYGDTDSIMIKWAVDEGIAKAYQKAEEASTAITNLLRLGLVEGASKPMLESASAAVTLANEKVYCPYLLIQKKTYAGLKYELKNGLKPESDENFSQSIDMKGIDAVRRDRSKLVKTISEKILNALLFKKDIKSAIQGLEADVNLVSSGLAPLEWFVLSKSLKGTYKTENQPHVKAWHRMISRGDQDIPEIGSRMPYVIVASKKKGPLYEHSEHPEFVRTSKLLYCAKYYLENARDVVERLLSPTTEGQRVSGIFKKALQDAEHKASGNMSLLSFFKRV